MVDASGDIRENVSVSLNGEGCPVVLKLFDFPELERVVAEVMRDRFGEPRSNDAEGGATTAEGGVIGPRQNARRNASCWHPHARVRVFAILGACRRLPAGIRAGIEQAVASLVRAACRVHRAHLIAVCRVCWSRSVSQINFATGKVAPGVSSRSKWRRPITPCSLSGFEPAIREGRWREGGA